MPSTVVASANYDVETSTLRITFVSGLIYDYKQVPKEIYEAMMKSGSKGIYLNNKIKGKYDFKKIVSSNPFQYSLLLFFFNSHAAYKTA